MTTMTAHDELAAQTVRTVLVAEIHTLDRNMRTLADYTTAKIRRAGYLTPQASKAQDESIRLEREERRLQAAELQIRPGFTAAPANLDVLDGLATIRSELAWLEQLGWYALRICRIARPVDMSDLHLLAEVAHITEHVTDVDWLNQASVTVSRLNDISERLIHGEEKAQLPVGCPYCKRMTLVEYIHPEDRSKAEIVCGRDPDSAEHESCLCGAPDEDCGCVHGRRHRWPRITGGYGRLQALIRREDKTA